MIINSVQLENFRGLSSLKVPLSRVTMLTGTNGVGKTSVLEGLYCLFSETKLDVSPLTRYNRTLGVILNQAHNVPLGIAARQDYNYRLFWDECPAYGEKECTVSAQSGNGLKWEWSYMKAGFSDLDKQTLTSTPIPVDSSTKFALWNWTRESVRVGGRSNKNEPVPIKASRAQILPLPPDGGLYLSVPVGTLPNSVCRYLDFATLRVQPNQLPLATAKRLTQALQIINSRVTDVRISGVGGGLNVVLDGEHERSLGTLGNGSVTWVSALISIFETIENTDLTTDPPFLFLIDEIGAGVHYSAMLEMWRYLHGFSEKNPRIQFVTTSHSDDCIHAFCEAFMDADDASSIVRLHKIASDGVIVPTIYAKDKYPTIMSGDWEVRG